MNNFHQFSSHLNEILTLSCSIWPSGFYSLNELIALYHAAQNTPRGSTIVEIGMCAGRSSSILFQVAKETDSNIIFIDPWVYEPQLCPAVFERVCKEFPTVPWLHYKRRAEDISHLIPNDLGFIHIDGDHQAISVERDCRLYLPKLRNGCVAAFHDYDDPRYLGVKEEIERATKGWEDLGLFGRLKIKRKP